MTIRGTPLVVLGLDVDGLDALGLLQAGHVDFVVEVAAPVGSSRGIGAGARESFLSLHFETTTPQ